ncbi:MAG: radical SAM family heme chaperone HemW [Rhodobacterales bacterium]|jgi:putative oxygen-independent coproporphyrinogen III oxidase|tara:strand:- start:3137 stop:4294 length:1158 start_codon:yes stop_codon:yes gene_type:complete
MVKNWQRAGFGLYIHWPFCQSKCPYCDFNSHVSSNIDQEAWTEAYLSEISNNYHFSSEKVLNTVFFGGGTPSLMPSKTIETIITHILSLWKTSNQLEITLEANPTSIDVSRFKEYRSAGVNRVSVGVQSLDDTSLKCLGRLHTGKEAIIAVQTAQSVFDRVSFDLIYARQNQTIKAWEQELLSALSLGTNHMSLYQLTIEDGTVFGDRAKIGKLPGLPSEDLSADMYTLTQEIMSSNRLPLYEVSNHAFPGEESRHNLIYWRGGDFIGIGPGAHGRYYQGPKRKATVMTKNPNKWLSQIKRLGHGAEPSTVLSKSDEALEYLMMSARLVEGTDLKFLDTLDLNLLNYNNIKGLKKLGLIFVKNERMVVTPEGRPVLNSVLSELIS